MVSKSEIVLPSPLDQLDQSGKRHRMLDRGELLFRQGDKSRGLFYVEQWTPIIGQLRDDLSAFLHYSGVSYDEKEEKIAQARL